MTPIEIGKIPWLPLRRGDAHRHRQQWLKRADYHALYAIGADTGPLKLGTTNDVRQRASQLRTDTRAPRWLRVCYWAPRLFARRVLADVTAKLEPVHLGSGWYEIDAAEVEGLTLAAAGKAGITLRDHTTFLAAVEAARFNEQVRHGLRHDRNAIDIGPLRTDELPI